MEDRPQSDFNMAVSYLNRLNALFYIADEAAMQLNAYAWFQSLLTLFRELSTEMTDTELKEMEEKITKLAKLINNWNDQINKTGKSTIPPELNTNLHRFELDLRKVLKHAGLQLRMKEDPNAALR